MREKLNDVAVLFFLLLLLHRIDVKDKERSKFTDGNCQVWTHLDSESVGRSIHMHNHLSRLPGLDEVTLKVQ